MGTLHLWGSKKLRQSGAASKTIDSTPLQSWEPMRLQLLHLPLPNPSNLLHV